MTVKRPLTPADLAGAATVFDPQLSPDGALVAFVVGEETRTGDQPRSAIWLAEVAGEAPARRFSAGLHADSAPRWSPDGRALAFLSDRAAPGSPQAYIVPIAGGEAAPLPALPGAVEDLRWSPDGAGLALRLSPAPDEGQRARVAQRDDAQVFGEDWRPAQLWTLRLEGGQPTRITPPERHTGAFAWSPDGRELAVLSLDSPWEDAYYGPLALDAYPATGGPGRRLAAVRGPATHLCWSRDGATLAYLGTEGRVHTGGAISTVPATGGEPRLAWPGYPGTVEWLDWAPDGRALLCAALEDLQDVLLRVELDAQGAVRAPRQLLPGAARDRGYFGGEVARSADARVFAIVRSQLDAPPELWAGPPERLRQRSAIQAATAAWALGTPVRLHWEARDGLRIGGLLLYPARYRQGRRYPLVTLIHGGPDWHWADYFPAGWAQLLASNGYAVLLPNPRGGTGRGAAFVDATWDDYGGEELHDTLRGIDLLVARGVADPERLGIGGWSHGGYMAAWAVTQTARFRAAIMGAGVADLLSDQGQNDIPRCNDDYFPARSYDDPDAYLRRSPIAHLGRAGTPTLILHGGEDARVHPAQGREFYAALRQRGVPATLVSYPREGHQIEERAHRIDLLARVLGWYDRWLRG